MTWYVPWHKPTIVEERRNLRSSGKAHFFDDASAYSLCGRIKRDEKPWVAVPKQPENYCWICAKEAGR